MDFSITVHDQGYKYIESPVIYKFPSEKFLNKKSPFSINNIGNQLFKKEHPDETSQEKFDNLMNYQSKTTENQLQNISNGKGLFESKNSTKSNTYNNINNNNQRQPSNMSQSKDRYMTNQPLYSKLNNHNQQPYRQSKIQTTNERQNYWQRKPSQQFSYYHKYFSPDNIKSSNLPPFSPQNTVSRLSLPRSSGMNEELARYEANQLIFKTQKELLEKEIHNLKIQLKNYQEKVSQLNEQKQEWIRCKNRNEILERQYKMLNEEYIRLKDSNLSSIQHNKWRSSDVQRVDLKEFTAEEFAKKLMLQKRHSYEIKSVIDDSLIKEQVKHLNERISQLEKEIQMWKSQNILLKEQNRQIKLNTFQIKRRQSSNVNQQQQIILLKQQIMKLQRQKQSYVSNYKILKNERQKQSKELKAKQEEIYQSLKKLNRDLSEINIEKQSLQGENKKLKRKITELQDQIAIINKKYSTIKIDYQQVSNNLHSTQQQNFFKNKNRRTSFQDRCLQLEEQLRQARSKNKQKIQNLQQQKQDQKQQVIKKYQQKANSLQTQITQLKDQIRQYSYKIKDSEKQTKRYQKQNKQNEQKIQKYEVMIKELQHKCTMNQNLLKDYEEKIKKNEKDYQQKLSKLQKNYTTVDIKASQSQQKMKSQQSTIKMMQEKIIKLQSLLESKQSQNLKKENEIQSIKEMQQEKWKQLIDVKQKFMEMTENLLQLSNEKDSLKQQCFVLRKKVGEKQQEVKFTKRQSEAEINRYEMIIGSLKQRQIQSNMARQQLISSKQNQIKKQRVQIQGLLQQIVKLRQVKSQNYKLMQKQKQLIKMDETISHLWAVKQTQYENIAQIFDLINNHHQKKQ